MTVLLKQDPLEKVLGELQVRQLFGPPPLQVAQVESQAKISLSIKQVEGAGKSYVDIVFRLNIDHLDR